MINTPTKTKETTEEKVRKTTRRGIGSRKLKQHLKYIVPEVRLALIKEPGRKPVPITTPGDLGRLIEPLKHYAEEHFVAFHLDCKFNVTGHQIVSRGTVSASLVHPREVFKAAILANAFAIIVAHNHPAGSLNPSREDIETTEKLIAVGELLGIKLIDHVIVSSNGLNSMRENHSGLWI
jgi:DNA repair protein RadC